MIANNHIFTNEQPDRYHTKFTNIQRSVDAIEQVLDYKFKNRDNPRCLVDWDCFGANSPRSFMRFSLFGESLVKLFVSELINHEGGQISRNELFDFCDLATSPQAIRGAVERSGLGVALRNRADIPDSLPWRQLCGVVAAVFHDSGSLQICSSIAHKLLEPALDSLRAQFSAQLSGREMEMCSQRDAIEQFFGYQFNRPSTLGKAASYEEDEAGRPSLSFTPLNQLGGAVIHSAVCRYLQLCPSHFTFPELRDRKRHLIANEFWYDTELLRGFKPIARSLSPFRNLNDNGTFQLFRNVVGAIHLDMDRDQERLWAIFDPAIKHGLTSEPKNCR